MEQDNQLNRTISKHVSAKCATYAGEGRCLLDRPCPFFDESNDAARCHYYENAVLPEDDKLKTRYWARFGLEHWNSSNVKTCDECGKGFEAKSNAQKYCESCSTEVKRRQKSAQNRRSYERSKNKE